MNAPSPSAPADALAAVLRTGPPLRVAFLFGSATTGALRPDSDLDVAILPVQPDLSLTDELALQAALAAACGRSVDLVRLDGASTLVRFQVARDGIVLLEGGPFEAARFRAAAASEYLDFAPALALAGETFRRRLVEQGTAKGRS